MNTERSCRVIRGGEGYDGAQDLSYAAGVSAESAGARGLCLHTLVIPPGGRARAHLHTHHESAIYLVSGEGEMWWGDGLAHHEGCRQVTSSTSRAGCPTCLPTAAPLSPLSPSWRGPTHEQESVVLLLELDAAQVGVR